jgi:S-disulfanyl-L-cysteine oxidoreductase SoxD
MRYSFSLFAVVIALAIWVPAWPQGRTYQLGSTPSAEELTSRDIAISPDGKELPPGSGTAKEGATVFAQKCAACHGQNGNGGGLTRGIVPLGNAKPVKIGFSLVPYATTVWDFINRAMPQSKPGSLTVNEVYAATAYVLYRNDIIKETDVLDARTLPRVRMPNRDNFLPEEPGWRPGQKRPFGYYP